MKRNNNSDDDNRRKFLKSAATISAGLALPATTATAGPSQEKKRRAEQRKYEALSERRTTVSTEKFHQQLKNAGFGVFSNSYGYSISNDGKSVQKNAEGDVSVLQGFPSNDLTATVSIFEGKYNTLADLDWTVETEGWEGGAPPKDNITLAWSDNQYMYDGESHNVSDGDLSLRTRESTGAVWMWDDNSGQSDWETEDGNVTAYLQSQDDCHTRHVYGTYEHTWSDVSISSITIGSGGVSIVYGDDNKRWKVFPEDEFGGTC